MASDFQDQFREAMREAEVADLKRQFDEASAKATSAFNNPLETAQKEVEAAFGTEPARKRRACRDRNAIATDRSRRDRAARRPSIDGAADAAGRRAAGKRRWRRSSQPTAQARRRRMSNRKPGRRGRDRAEQGALARSSDRIALAPDQGADRVRGRLRRSASSSPSRSTTSWSGRSCWVAGVENSKFIYTALLEYFLTQLKLAMFGAAFHRVSGDRRADLHVRGARAFIATSARPSFRI